LNYHQLDQLNKHTTDANWSLYWRDANNR